MISIGYLAAGFDRFPVRQHVSQGAIAVHHDSDNQEQAGTEYKKQFENTFHCIFSACVSVISHHPPRSH